MKSVLITGGSSGIGLEMSRYFAKDAYHLLWVSLAEDELLLAKAAIQKEFPKIQIDTLALDLSKTNAANEVFQWTQSNHWEVDVLVNNAGFGLHGYVNNLAIEKELAMIHCNVIAMYTLSRLFLKPMIEKDHGVIINISSNSSFQPVPRMSTYASTKAFVRHFSRALSGEMKMLNSKVRVITVCPSAIKDTAFRKKEGLDKVKTFEGLAYTTTKEVAKDVWKGFKGNKDFIVTGWRMRLLYSFHHLIPYNVTQFLTRKETELQ